MSLTSLDSHLPKVQPGYQTGRAQAGQANRPDHEAALEWQPLPKGDNFKPSAELAETQAAKPVGGVKSDQKIQELKKSTERTRTQAARNRQGSPKASDSKGGAANVQAARQPEPASATKQVKKAGMGQTQMGERKFPRPVDRGSYINNLKATFGEA